jgi:O-antigen/teichoic acid export membrane protein
MAASQAIVQIARFGFMIALARLLAPAEFGLFGMALVFTGFAALIGDMGLAAALIQKETIEPRDLNTAFWMNIGLGFLMCAMMIAASVPLSRFYGAPMLTPLLIVASFEFVIRGASVIHRVLLVREMNFRVVAYAEAASVFVAGTTACIMAIMDTGAWSLIAQNLSATFMVSLWLVVARPWRPEWRFDRQCLRELLHFGLHLQAFNLLNYWVRNFDKFLIGRQMGDASLGYYNRAYSTMLLPQSQIIGILERVMWPALARCAHDNQRLQHAYIRTLGVICLVNFPCLAGLAAVAGDFVPVVFGAKWTPSIGTLQWLCLAGFVQTPVSTLGWLYLATGRTRRLLIWGIISGAVIIPALWMGSKGGTIEAMAIWYAGASVLLAPMAFLFASPVAKIGFLKIAKAVTPSATAALIMSGAIVFVGLLLDKLPTTPRLMLNIFVGALIFMALSFRTVAWQNLRASLTSLQTSSTSQEPSATL